MNGEIQRSEIALSYRRRFVPLRAAHINADLNELAARYSGPVTKLIMWEHQLDFILKSDARYSVIADGNTTVVSIYGIPVELCEE